MLSVITGNKLQTNLIKCIIFYFFQLNAEQRSEMCDHRRRAVQLEVDRQNQQRNNLLARVQDILDQAQVSSTV